MRGLYGMQGQLPGIRGQLPGIYRGGGARHGPLTGDVHHWKDGDEREHGQAPRGGEAHDNAADEGGGVGEHRRECGIDGSHHCRHVLLQPLLDVARAHAVEEGDVLFDHDAEEAVAHAILAHGDEASAKLEEQVAQRLEHAQQYRDDHILHNGGGEAVLVAVAFGGGGAVDFAHMIGVDDVIKELALQRREEERRNGLR